MGIDLEITKGDWNTEIGDSDYYDNEYFKLGPIKTARYETILEIDNKDDAVATVCVPQFKAVADAAEHLITNTDPFDMPANFDAMTKIMNALKGLKDRIAKERTMIDKRKKSG